MIKLPKTNTLRFQFFFIAAIMTCVLIVLLGISIRGSFTNYKNSEDYVLKNEITNHLNAAAIWQAVERGYGATIIGSGEGDSSPLFTNFLEAAEKGDAEVLQADKKMNILLSTRKNEAYENKLFSWIMGYGDLVDARPRVSYKNISKYEWFEIATNNISNEFDLRNITFTPLSMEEEILYLNSVLLPTVTELCEYAGRERALIGNTIASGQPISNETIKSIKHYRSVVERSSGKILLLKDLPSTSSKMKQAIEAFDKEFLQEYQLLREEVFSSSERQAKEIKSVKEQILKKSTTFQDYLHGISTDLLSMSKHKSVTALAKALRGEDDAYISERLIAVENLFEAFSQIKKFYAQILLLDSFGHELVRVDFDGDTSKTIRGLQLQDKSDRYYFKESINLPKGEIYTSPLDLNMENGRIEYPYKPVMRFATPVYADGKQNGVIVFNLLANTSFLLHKDTKEERTENYILANQNGFYIHHPDVVKEWGMMEMLNKSHHNIREDYPDAAEEILSGKYGVVHLASGRVIVYEPWFLDIVSDTDKFWVFIKQIKGVEYPVSTSAWFNAATKAIDTGVAILNIASVETKTNALTMEFSAKRNILLSVIILVSAIIIFFLFIWWSRSRVLIPIQKLNLTTQNIIKGDLSYKPVISSSDEIGELAVNLNKMTDKLTKAKSDWESTFNSMGDIITLFDKDSRLIRFNKTLTSSLNIEPEYIAGTKCYDFNNNNDLLFPDKIMEVSKKKIPVTVEIEEPDLGRVFSISSFPRFDNNGEFVGTVQIARDISEHKYMENEIRRGKEYSDNLLDNAQDAIISIDENGVVIVWNKTAENIFGYLKSEIIGQPITNIIPERFKKQHEDGLQRFLNTGKEKIIGKTVQVSGKTKKGIEIPIEMSLSFQKDEEGRCSFMAIIRDISEKRKHEDKVRHLASFPQLNATPVLEVDHSGSITFHNNAASKALKELGLKEDLTLFLPENISEILKDLEGEDSKQLYCELEIGGSIFGENLNYIPEFKVLRIYAGDITERKKVEDMLKSSNQKLELLFSSIPSILIELTKDWKVSLWNLLAEATFEIDASSVAGKPFRECGIQWDWDKVIEKVSICQETNCSTWIDDLQYGRPDGSYGYLGVTINPISINANVQSGVLLLGSDITERKDMERQLLHAQKMEAIGGLAAGIAHEINTPIQFISDNIFFLQNAFGKTTTLLNKYSRLLEMNKAGAVTPEFINEVDVMARDIKVGYLIKEIPEALKESQDGLKRVTEIVQSMRTFSHPDHKEKELVDINEMIKSTITVSRNEWKYVTDMELDFDTDLPLVPCYPGGFNQVILNLIINAAYAIGEVTGNGDVGKGKISVSTQLIGDWAEIHISDTGGGISEDIRSKIFDPFFTTKEVGRGTGQGLSLVHSIVVKKHNGTITFDTITGKGTTFKICLPINQSLSEKEESNEKANTLC